jgi:hypothetical protein
VHLAVLSESKLELNKVNEGHECSLLALLVVKVRAVSVCQGFETRFVIPLKTRDMIEDYKNNN